MSLRVLHVLWDGGLGGVQRYVKQIAATRHDALEHGICVFSGLGDVINAATFDGPLWELRLERGLQLSRAAGFRKSVHAFNPAVIHCHCDTPAFSLQLPFLRSRGLVYTEHGDTLVRRRNDLFTRAIANTLGRSYDTILINSAYAKRLFTSRYPGLDARCRVLPNPLFEPWHGHLPPAETRGAQVGFFGRLDHNKGFDRILEAMPLLRKGNPAIKVQVYGRGPLEDQFKTQCEQLGLADSVQFNGYTSTTLDDMATCQVILVPSRIEAFGLVALEAQSVGLPVVAFSDNGVEEIVKDGETGLIVPQGDIPGFANAVLALLSDFERAAQFGEAGRQRAQKEFALAGHLESLVQVYRQSTAQK